MTQCEYICPHFRRCGGCATQDLDYLYELEIKEKRFKDAFPGVNPELVLPIQYHVPYGYRSRMDFLFHNYKLCQRLQGNFRIKIPLNECHIAHPAIDFCLKKINRWFEERRDDLPYLESPKNFNYRLLKYVTIRKPFHSQKISITFVVNQEGDCQNKWKAYLKDNLNSLLEALSSLNPHILIGYVKPQQELSITPNFEVIKGRSVLQEILDGKTFFFHSQGFFQNNSIMIEKMIYTIKSWLDEYKLTHDKTDIYDLYGGCGVFGIALAEKFKHIWVVDTEGLNIELATNNFINNGYHTYKVIMRNVKDFLEWDEYIKGMRDGIVIVDPPRSGLGAKVVNRLLQRRPKAIFYVSCNYSVLAQELKQFIKSGVYQLRRLAPYDFFPRTPHLEVLALFTLKYEH